MGRMVRFVVKPVTSKAKAASPRIPQLYPWVLNYFTLVSINTVYGK